MTGGAGAPGGRCAPDGTVAIGGSCTRDADGLDDCTNGATCVGGTCRRFCRQAGAPACPADYTCGIYSGILDESTEGVCDPTCDPVTQVRLFDDAPACGSPDPGAPTLGCYGPLEGPFTCVNVPSTALGHGGVPMPVYLNSCVPGVAAAVRYEGDVTCVAYCSPAVTYMGNDSLRTGNPPHTCGARGATGLNEECRFIHVLQGTPNAFGNQYGLCLDHARIAATSGMSFPSCSALPDTDTDGDGVPQHVEHGCAPLP
jgi:hypothetical protein